MNRVGVLIALKQSIKKKSSAQAKIVLSFLSLVPMLTTILLNKLGIAVGLSMSGLQVSDSNGWNSCIKSTAIFSTFPNGSYEWCMRRPIYPLLAGLEYRIFQNTSLLIAFNSLIFGLISIWVFIECRKLLSRSATFLLLLYAWCYWAWFGASQTMSESLGMIVGIVSVGLACKALINQDLKSISYLTFSLTFISIIRPGNLLAVLFPLALLFLPRHKGHRIKAIMLVIPIFFLPVQILKFTSKLFGLDNFLHGGNLWATLYGLANGNQDWTAAYRDYSERNFTNEIELWRVVRQDTIEQILMNPMVLVESVIKNIVYFFGNQIPFLSPKNIPPFTGIRAISLILLVAVLVLLVRFLINPNVFLAVRLSVFSLVSSTTLFYAVLLKSDPFRALSATQFLFVFCLLLLTKRSIKITSKSDPKTHPTKLGIKSVAVMLIPILILIIAMKFTLRPTSTYSGDIGIACESENSFFVHPDSFEMKRVSEIDLQGMYWWEDVIERIPNGYLIQGLTLDSNGLVQQINGFLPTPNLVNQVELENKCFSNVVDSTYNEYLNDISFIEIKIS